MSEKMKIKCEACQQYGKCWRLAMIGFFHITQPSYNAVLHIETMNREFESCPDINAKHPTEKLRRIHD